MNYRLATDADCRRIIEALHALPRDRDGRAIQYRVSVEEAKPTRSLEQNSRYWALLTAISQQAPDHMGGQWYSPEVWHEYCKRRFLGVEPGPYDTGVPQSTTKLKIAEFADYMTEVEVWADEQFPGFDFLWGEP